MIWGAGQQGDPVMGVMGPYGLKGAHGLDKIAKGTMFNHQNALGHNALGSTLNQRSSMGAYPSMGMGEALVGIL